MEEENGSLPERFRVDLFNSGNGPWWPSPAHRTLALALPLWAGSSSYTPRLQLRGEKEKLESVLGWGSGASEGRKIFTSYLFLKIPQEVSTSLILQTQNPRKTRVIK